MTKLPLLISLLFICGPATAADKPGPHSAVAQSKQAINAEDLKYGEQQVLKMISDRPQLKAILFKNEPIWPWAVRQYAKEAGNKRVSWDPSPIKQVSDEYDGENMPPELGGQGYIRVRKTDKKGRPLAASRVLAAFVFESFNMRSGPAFAKLDEEAINGKYTKEQYVEQGAKIEFAASAKLAEFYRTVYLPLAKKRHYSTDPEYWDATRPANFKNWLAQYTDHKGYPWSAWGVWYDERIVPTRKNHKDYEIAIKKYNLEQKKYEDDRKARQIFHWPH